MRDGSGRSDDPIDFGFESDERSETRPTTRRVTETGHDPEPTERRPSIRSVRFGLVPVVYVALAALAATGGARPTALGVADGVILAGGALAMAACARRARSIPVYVAGAVATVLQPDVVPMAVGIAGLVAAGSLQLRIIRRYTERRAVAAALAGGLAWCAMAGAPTGGAANLWPIPLAAFAWLAISSRINGGKAFRKRWTLITAVTFGWAFVFAALGALAIMTARPDVERGTDRLDDGLAAARSGDTDAATDLLQRGATSLDRGESRLTAWWSKPALLVPGVSQHVHALGQTVSAASDVADVATATADEVDLERFGASAGQLDPVAIAAVEEPLARLISSLEMAQSDIGELDDMWLLTPLSDQVDEASDRLSDASDSARLARDGVAVVPDLIGLNGPTTYLVLFTTPVEARAITGFPGNYAEIRFEGGRFDMTRFGRIADLNAKIPDGGADLDLDEEFRARYERFGVERIWQNITMSPDFPSVAEVAAQLYALDGGPQVDGVISVSPKALAAMLDFTGPIEVPEAGVTLDSDNAEQYLVEQQYLEFETDNPQRKDVLELLAEDAFAKLTNADLPGPRGLRNKLGPVVESGDLQFHAFETEAAEFLTEVGINGSFERTGDDLFAVTTTNAAGNKIDLFMERTLGYDVTWNVDTGEISATATVTLTNTAPASGLPPYLIENALGRRPLDIELSPGSNYSFVTLYSPWTSHGATLGGETVGLQRLPELGVNAYSLFVQLAPGESKTLTVDLLGQIDDFDYDLDVISQPGVTADKFEFHLRAEGGDELRFDHNSDPDEADATGSEADLSAILDRNLRMFAEMNDR